MLSGLIHQAQRKASRTARKAAFGAGGLVCIGIGVGFLTAAGWLFLITVTTALSAALIIGGAYLGLGLVLIGIASSSGSDSSHADHAHLNSKTAQTDPAVMVPQLINAFTSGLAAGQQTRSGPR